MLKELATCCFILSALAVPVTSVSGQKRSGINRPRNTRPRSDVEIAHEKAKQELTKATEEYKKSLTELIALQEVSARRAEEDLAKVKQLFTEGLLSKREVENKETAVAAERAKIAEARLKMSSADEVLAQTLSEADVLMHLARVPGANSGIVVHTAYFRFDGGSPWSLSRSGTIQSFFYSKFHRQLPISAFGQTSLHNQLGFDHSNAMDVGVNPDSAEGRALVAYLESAGIPFIAFRRAVPGAASGPHIHIGRPSHKL
jgi:hypothetical protein